MNSTRISWRMTVAFAALTALLLIVAALAMLQMATMRAQAQSITDRWLPNAMAIQRINAAVIELRSLQIQHVLNYSGTAMSSIEAAMSANRESFAKDAAAYRARALTTEDRTQLDSFLKSWASFLEVHEKVIELSQSNGKDAARSLIDDPGTRTQYGQAREALSKLVAFNERGADQSVEASTVAYGSARSTTLVTAAIAVLLAVAAAIWLIRSIVPPLKHAVEVADRVASGDLTGVIEVSRRDETGLLLQALARMQDSLASTAANVRSGAEQVATASAEIAQGNMDLSQRTEEQSSALQEIAATMDQLSSTVRNNVDSAMQARELAQSASTIAAQGGTVIGEVVCTMKDINSSSKKINEIIGVIDSIAFQTNILALNAAVEAARAGEQGRGFSVVAEEVRSLAHSSAEAAHQIKDLINSSVNQVDRGSALVDQAGQTMEGIVNAVRRVTEIVNEISVASIEQSNGVLEVGKAVTQMDSTAQQNAALVEESAAAAESLKHQAQQLVEAVEVFKVSRTSPIAADDVDTCETQQPMPVPLANS